MRTIETSSKFRKDYKRVKKRGYDLRLLEDVLVALLEDSPLPISNKDHALSGDYIGFRECHIQPDWLLIYRKDDSRLVLVAQRTGTHADLFDE